MTLKQFKNSGGFCKYLPHALADIDFGLKVLKKSEMIYNYAEWRHPEHSYEPVSKWSLRSYENPFLWTIFLLKNYNRYTFINILKAWYSAFLLKKIIWHLPIEENFLNPMKERIFFCGVYLLN